MFFWRLYTIPIRIITSCFFVTTIHIDTKLLAHMKKVAADRLWRWGRRYFAGTAYNAAIYASLGQQLLQKVRAHIFISS